MLLRLKENTFVKIFFWFTGSDVFFISWQQNLEPDMKYFIFTESTPFLGSLIFPPSQSGKMREPGSEVNLKSEIDGIVKLSFFYLN